MILTCKALLCNGQRSLQ